MHNSSPQRIKLLDGITREVAHYFNGKMSCERFYMTEHGPTCLHRVDGPAAQWNKRDKLIRESYWINGEPHREDGPAFQEWNDHGQLIGEEYWLNGKQLTKFEFTVKQWDKLPMEFFE